MRYKRNIIFLLLLFILLVLRPAQAEDTNQDSCLFLGSKPSFIIKLKNQYSDFKNRSALEKVSLQQLSNSGVKFIESRAMSRGAYIVFFQPDHLNGLVQVEPGCYSAESIHQLITRMERNKNIDYVDPNLLSFPRLLPTQLNVPVSAVQWDLLSPPGGIDVQNAWGINTGNANAITAVLDTGDLNNADLNPNIIGAVSFTNNGSVSSGAAPSCDSECRAYDHGTHVAGTVAASGILAYGQNIFGVAPTSKIVVVNVFSKFTNPADCRFGAPCLLTYKADQVNALTWLGGTDFSGIPPAPYVVGVNMSLGGPGACSTSIQDAFNNLFTQNISVAVAAGNDNINAATESPANCNGVVTVAATDRNGYGAPYSNYGAVVSLAAPGGDRSVLVNGVYSTSENGYSFKIGTSMATPHVAGLFALLYSIDPTLTPATTLNILSGTATPFPTGGPGFSCTLSKPCGAGIIDAYLAAQSTRGQAPILTWIPNIKLSQTSSSTVTLSWQTANWQPTRSAPTAYTVYLNGIAASACTHIRGLVCNLTNVSLYHDNTVYIVASDARFIYQPLKSPSMTFSSYPTLITPIITAVARNPLQKTQAFVYYSNSGFIYSGYSYRVNGIAGATVTYDVAKNRFIISNIDNPRKINNVSITINNNDPLRSQQVQTTSFIIPSILRKPL